MCTRDQKRNGKVKQVAFLILNETDKLKIVELLIVLCTGFMFHQITYSKASISIKIKVWLQVGQVWMVELGIREWNIISQLANQQENLSVWKKL